MNIESAMDKLMQFDAIFLIVGVKSDGRRGIPASFEWTIETANDEKNVCFKIKAFAQFRVFSLCQESKTMIEWENMSKKFQQDEIEEKEKKEFERLKLKYDKK
jgi:hypothetical protein